MAMDKWGVIKGASPSSFPHNQDVDILFQLLDPIGSLGILCQSYHPIKVNLCVFRYIQVSSDKFRLIQVNFGKLC